MDGLSFKIYGLVNPKDSNIFYVGMTSRSDLSFRLKEHISESGLKNPPNKPKCNFIKSIISQNQIPEIILIEEVSCIKKREIFRIEASWITHFKNFGMPLLNGGHYNYENKNITNMVSKTISDLSAFIKANNLKNAHVEKHLGLPKNSLSNFLSLKKELPKKWITPITDYILNGLANQIAKDAEKKLIEDSLGDLKDKVVPASEVKVPTAKVDLSKTFNAENYAIGIDKFRKSNDQISTQTSWITKIEDYCGANGLNPEDLIAAHSKLSKINISAKNALKEPKAEKPSMSNWREKQRAAKCGIPSKIS